MSKLEHRKEICQEPLANEIFIPIFFRRINKKKQKSLDDLHNVLASELTIQIAA